MVRLKCDSEMHEVIMALVLRQVVAADLTCRSQATGRRPTEKPNLTTRLKHG